MKRNIRHITRLRCALAIGPPACRQLRSAQRKSGSRQAGSKASGNCQTEHIIDEADEPFTVRALRVVLDSSVAEMDGVVVDIRDETESKRYQGKRQRHVQREISRGTYKFKVQ